MRAALLVVAVVALVVVVYRMLAAGPWSLRAEYVRDVDTALATHPPALVVTEADLSPLPVPVQQYLRGAGVVGHPRVFNYRVRFRGRIRSDPDARWMPFDADQVSTVDPPSRLFMMRAAYLGVPIDAFHRLRDGHATMRVRAAGLITVANESGPAMDRAETVTLFNDMCIMAPATLIDPATTWDDVGGQSARAHFTHGPHTIAATLHFDDRGRLIDFVSDDRSRAAGEGSGLVAQRFSTPLRDYRAFGPFDLAGFGEARWHPPEGVFIYGEFEMRTIDYNVTP